METGTIKKDGKGWKITLENGKSISITWSQIPPEWDGETIELLRENGQIVKMLCKGKEIAKQAAMPKFEVKRDYRDTPSIQGKRAYSPYNFIPLNDKVVAGIEFPGFEKYYYAGRYSGTINLEITTLTPLFIRGKKENFLLINGKPVLPGSSLRGMTRSLVEIASFGKFVHYYKRHLYHRIQGRDAAVNRRIGFLTLSNGKYIMYNAKSEVQSLIGRLEFQYQFTATGKRNMVGIYSGSMAKGKNFQIEYATDGTSFPVSDYVIKSYENDDTRNTEGEMGDLFFQLKNENSEFRKKFAEFSKGKELSFIGIPVWYELDSARNEVKHFGHCRNYRVPYPLSIDDYIHIPENLQNPDQTDFAEMIFGTMSKAGRVYFEDGITEMTDIFETNEAIRPKNLSSPKPTSYQHYLEQDGGRKKDWSDKTAKIRGYKLYWHRVTPTKKTDQNSKYSWAQHDPVRNEDSYPPPIKPVKTGVTFSSRIKFENLSPEELGCLLFVLELPDKCCHKLGMAKPLGLGSVQIKPSLTLINRPKRYSQLIIEDGSWNSGITETEEGSIKVFKDTFAAFIGKHGLNKDFEITGAAEKLWKSDRFRLMSKMLFFDSEKMKSENWLFETRYMSVDEEEFKDRPILPGPDDVAALGGLNT